MATELFTDRDRRDDMKYGPPLVTTRNENVQTFPVERDQAGCGRRVEGLGRADMEHVELASTEHGPRNLVRSNSYARQHRGGPELRVGLHGH